MCDWEGQFCHFNMCLFNLFWDFWVTQCVTLNSRSILTAAPWYQDQWFCQNNQRCSLGHAKYWDFWAWLWHQDSQCCPGAWYMSSHIHSSSLFTEFHTKIHPHPFRPWEGSHFIQRCWCYWIYKDVFLQILAKTSLGLEVVPQEFFLWVDKQLFGTRGAVLTGWTDSGVAVGSLTWEGRSSVPPLHSCLQPMSFYYSSICLCQRNVSMKAMYNGQSFQFSHPLVRNSSLSPRKLLNYTMISLCFEKSLDF